MNARLEQLELRSMMSADIDAAIAPVIRAVHLSNVIEDGQPAISFDMKWFSEDGVDRASLDDTDLRVVTPYGDNFQVRLKKTYGSGNTDAIRAEYVIRAVNGLWGEEDNGTYSIRLRSNSVFSMTGQATASGTIAQFEVDVETSFNAQDPFDVQLAWSNFQADEWIPQSVVDQFNRPIWMNQAQWGFSVGTMGASVGPNASNLVALDSALAYAQEHGSIVVLDLESYWPVYSGWWYGGTGEVTQEKIDIVHEHAADALEFIQAVAARKPEGVQLAAYVPNGLFWGDQEAYEQLIVQEFVGQFTPYIDVLAPTIYRHPNDSTPEIYGNRVGDVVDSYSLLNKPIIPVTWPNAQGLMSDEYRMAMIDGIRQAGAQGVIIWDDISREWSPNAARTLHAFLQAKVGPNQNRVSIEFIPIEPEQDDRQSVWNELWFVA